MANEKEEKNRCHTQIKGNKKAIDKILKLAEKIESLGVEVQLTIEKSGRGK
jgi:hypothetical protein